MVPTAAAAAAEEQVRHETPAEAPAPTTTVSPIATNEFLPEDRDLTDCIGVLERPGCGSESRGGWRQFAVFALIAVGMVVIFGNVVRGVRRNRATLDAPTSSSSET